MEQSSAVLLLIFVCERTSFSPNASLECKQTMTLKKKSQKSCNPLQRIFLKGVSAVPSNCPDRNDNEENRMNNSVHKTRNALTVIAMTVMSALPTFAIPPANDDIANAVVVTQPLPFSASTSSVDATITADDPDCAGNDASAKKLCGAESSMECKPIINFEIL
jgi:hypothetical protein